jgi:hypothetical protein
MRIFVELYVHVNVHLTKKKQNGFASLGIEFGLLENGITEETWPNFNEAQITYKIALALSTT